MTITTPARPPIPKVNDGIRRLLLATGLTNTEFALRLGVGPTTVYNWISGITNPSDRNVLRIAQRFGVSQDELLAGLPDLFPN